MNYKEFIKKYSLSGMNKDKLSIILAALDILYLEYTREEITEMVKDYLDNADNIFNTGDLIKLLHGDANSLR